MSREVGQGEAGCNRQGPGRGGYYPDCRCLVSGLSECLGATGKTGRMGMCTDMREAVRR
ncbi:hypothetical protein CTAM01_07511 [Colletotrichum tamarilloi]|uniref:Uncharacterized protein n=1 Tax=Colletotrichum tamarilloi TaxID=1209934 RepID=A0ABQ9R945_9PEZI|nr:uncharacterized protein CTAM01_07511 [Colletotrichum tamarilloi]KAK1498293.1 hypothetical protein CTAM01_07511 [Colletotrichum tamarilloi]